MKEILIILATFLLVGCGGGSSTRSVDDGNYFKYQWNINPNSIYYTNGKATRGADIDLIPAWSYTKGGGVKVAVIDDCFDVTHEDLRDNIISTYNANTKSNYVGGKECHGTEVAGVIGASDNGFGIVGVAPKIKLVLIGIDFKNSTEDDYLKAFNYAKNQNAKVVNCSWGSEHISQALSAKLEDMKDSNIAVVFASGNDRKDLDENGINDESEDSSVIGVGATNEKNDIAIYSNYSSNLDILAPGGGIIPNVYPIKTSLGIFTTSKDKAYVEAVGTSFAAPTVSGVIALMYAKNPSLTFDEVYEAITKTAEKVGLENGADYNISGFDKYRAYGKIDAGKAINY